MIQGEMLADLSVFVAAVEAGGFAAAASRLNLTRSAVGRLERRLGVRLFHRTTRSLALTDDGQAFFEHGRRALGEVQAAAAMPVLFGRLRVAPILIGLVDAHPRLDLDLNFNERLVDVAEDGFDLVVRNGPLQNWPGLTGGRVAHQHMRVCASPGYLAASGAPASLADLASHRAVLYGRPGRLRSWLFPGRTAPRRRSSRRAGCASTTSARSATLRSAATASPPCWLIRDEVAAGRLATLLDHLPSHVFDTHALWPHVPYLPLRVRLAIDALAAALPETTDLTPTIRRKTSASALP